MPKAIPLLTLTELSLFTTFSDSIAAISTSTLDPRYDLSRSKEDMKRFCANIFGLIKLGQRGSAEHHVNHFMTQLIHELAAARSKCTYTEVGVVAMSASSKIFEFSYHINPEILLDHLLHQLGKYSDDYSSLISDETITSFARAIIKDSMYSYPGSDKIRGEYHDPKLFIPICFELLICSELYLSLTWQNSLKRILRHPAIIQANEAYSCDASGTATYSKCKIFLTAVLTKLKEVDSTFSMPETISDPDDGTRTPPAAAAASSRSSTPIAAAAAATAAVVSPARTRSPSMDVRDPSQ